MPSKVRSFIESARTVNTITDKITADSKVNADLLENHPSSYFAPVASPTFTGTVSGSTLKTNAAQIGQSATATNNFTLYQPASPDGTVRLGVGNAGSVTDVMQFQQYGVGIPRGTTAQRPTSPVEGMIRFNTTIKSLEYYDSYGIWSPLGSAMPLNGLQLWLPLRGNVNDVSGNGRNGTASGITYTTGPSGTTNTAALVNSGDSITVSYTAPAQQKTMAFWYKASWNSQTDAFRIGFQGNTNGNGFMFMQGVGSVYDLGFWGYGTRDYTVGTSFGNIWISNDQWNHVAAIWNGSSSLIYLNGVAQTQYYNGSTSSTMSLIDTLTSTTFNIDNAVSDVSVSGVAVWNRILSADEIRSAMNATRG